MLPYPNIDPTIIEIGPFKPRWYGLMYVIGFIAAYLLIGIQQKARRIGLQRDTLQHLIFYIGPGLMVGARLGYILFYQFAHLHEYIYHPWEVIAVWHGGMSFHGGLIGAVFSVVLFCRRHHMPFWDVADTVVVTAPIGLALGRLGNFINGELYGRQTDVPWAMVFPGAEQMPRHPSQLYEALLEGVLLFIVLWKLKDRGFRPGAMVCCFLGGYGAFRFLAEAFRQPDAHMGLFFDLLSMGQILSLCMVAAAPFLWWLLPRGATSDAGTLYRDTTSEKEDQG
jgi:phosphatidylglycerol:prolipoprotein diacylglycerol transferase